MENGKDKLQEIIDMEIKTTEIPVKNFLLKSSELAELIHQGSTYPVVLDKSAWQDILRISGLTVEASETLAHNMGSGTDIKLINKILDILKHKNENLVLLRNAGKISKIGLASVRTSIIPKEKLVEIMEYMLGANHDLVLDHVFLNPEEGRFSMRIYNNARHVLPIPGEDVSTGLSLHWQFDEPVEVREYVLRLVCANGMVGDKVKGTKRLTASHSAEDWMKILWDPKRDEELLAKYTSYVTAAKKVNLSVAEFERIKAHAMNHYPNDISVIARELGDEMWRLDYEQRGIDFKKLPEEAWANCPTPVNAWQAVNLLTYLSSHKVNSGVRDYQRDKTQFFAGKILSTNWDAEAQVFGVPQYEVSPFKYDRFREPDVQYIGEFNDEE